MVLNGEFLGVAGEGSLFLMKQDGSDLKEIVKINRELKVSSVVFQPVEKFYYSALKQGV
jgi:hypothetical protein